MLTKLQIERLKIIRNLINEILDEGNMLFDEKANLEQCVNLLEWHIATPKADEKYGYKIPFTPVNPYKKDYCVITCQGPHISPSLKQESCCFGCGRVSHFGPCKDR